jgi:hypothetical protein
MQKITLSSLRISELIENPRPSTHKRRLFSRFALGTIGMHDSTGITASFRQTKRHSMHFDPIVTIKEIQTAVASGER